MLTGEAEWANGQVTDPFYSWSVYGNNIYYEELVEEFEIGEETSTMENLIEGIEMVVICNECRQLENETEGTELCDLLISPILMACEELQLNYVMDTDIDGHPGTFSIAENLVYGAVADIETAYYA